MRQEEKRRLLRRNNELKKECAHLEEEDKKLNETLKVKKQLNNPAAVRTFNSSQHQNSNMKLMF